MQSWFFEKINKIGKLLTKTEKRQMINIMNERRQITTYHMDIKMVIKEYNEQNYVHNFKNIDEMD